MEKHTQASTYCTFRNILDNLKIFQAVTIAYLAVSSPIINSESLKIMSILTELHIANQNAHCLSRALVCMFEVGCGCEVSAYTDWRRMRELIRYKLQCFPCTSSPRYTFHKSTIVPHSRSLLFCAMRTFTVPLCIFVSCVLESLLQICSALLDDCSWTLKVLPLLVLHVSYSHFELSIHASQMSPLITCNWI